MLSASDSSTSSVKSDKSLDDDPTILGKPKNLQSSPAEFSAYSKDTKSSKSGLEKIAESVAESSPDMDFKKASPDARIA